MVRGGLTLRRAVLVAVLLSVLPVWFGVSASAGDPTRCERFAASSKARAELVTGSGPDVLVVGDSWSAGLGLDDLADSWPTRLRGTVHVAAFSGSGFSRHAIECGDESFATRAGAALTGSIGLVVVEGGLNDYDRTDAEIRAGFDRLVTTLADHRVVVVGPASAPSRAVPARHVDRLLERLTLAAGWEYVPSYHWDLAYLPDRLHLTVDGHREFGDRVAEAVGAPA